MLPHTKGSEPQPRSPPQALVELDVHSPNVLLAGDMFPNLQRLAFVLEGNAKLDIPRVRAVRALQ